MSRSEPEPKYVLRDSNVTACIFHCSSSTGLLMLTGSSEGVIKVWQVKSKRAVEEVSGHVKSVLWLGMVGDSHVLSQGRDGHVTLWSLDGCKLTTLGSYSCSDIGFCQCALYAVNGTCFLLAVPSATSQSDIEIIDIDQEKFSDQDKRTLKVARNQGMTMTMLFCNKNRILTGHESGSVVLWDAKMCRQLCDMKLHTEPIMCLDYSPQTCKGFSGSADNSVVCWTVTDDSVQLCNKIEITNPGLNAIKIRQDNKIFATAGWDHRVRIFSFKKLSPLAVLTFHRDSIQCVAFSNCGTMAAVSKDGQITFWDLYNG